MYFNVSVLTLLNQVRASLEERRVSASLFNDMTIICTVNEMFFVLEQEGDKDRLSI